MSLVDRLIAQRLSRLSARLEAYGARLRAESARVRARRAQLEVYAALDVQIDLKRDEVLIEMARAISTVYGGADLARRTNEMIALIHDRRAAARGDDE